MVLVFVETRFRFHIQISILCKEWNGIGQEPLVIQFTTALVSCKVRQLYEVETNVLRDSCFTV